MTERRWDVYDASAWILRGGLTASIAFMLLGVFESFREGSLSLQLVQTRRFDPNLTAILKGAVAWEGPALAELGVLLLVLTPILRVASSLFLFARERDRLYTAITFAVLCLTTASLILGR